MEIPILIDQATLDGRIRELAEAFAARYREDPPLVITVLEGARRFASVLGEHADGAFGERACVRVGSYGDATTSSGTVRLLEDTGRDVTGRRVVLVEDIVDTGRTVSFLIEHFRRRGARSVEVCTLLSKPERRVIDVPVALCGFEIPDVFVVGFGMDVAGRLRDLPYIGIYPETDVAAGG